MDAPCWNALPLTTPNLPPAPLIDCRKIALVLTAPSSKPTPSTAGNVVTGSYNAGKIFTVGYIAAN